MQPSKLREKKKYFVCVHGFFLYTVCVMLGRQGTTMQDPHSGSVNLHMTQGNSVHETKQAEEELGPPVEVAPVLRNAQEVYLWQKVEDVVNQHLQQEHGIPRIQTYRQDDPEDPDTHYRFHRDLVDIPSKERIEQDLLLVSLDATGSEPMKTEIRALDMVITLLLQLLPANIPVTQPKEVPPVFKDDDDENASHPLTMKEAMQKECRRLFQGSSVTLQDEDNEGDEEEENEGDAEGEGDEGDDEVEEEGEEEGEDENKENQTANQNTETLEKAKKDADPEEKDSDSDDFLRSEDEELPSKDAMPTEDCLNSLGAGIHVDSSACEQPEKKSQTFSSKRRGSDECHGRVCQDIDTFGATGDTKSDDESALVHCHQFFPTLGVLVENLLWCDRLGVGLPGR